MSGKIQKSQIPIKHYETLHPQVKEAIIQVKNDIRNGHPGRGFSNNRGAQEGDGPPLPALPAGSVYREYDVGGAHPQAVDPNDPHGRGCRRLVFEVQEPSNRIMEIYYTEDHYLKTSFIRVVY